MKRGGIAVLALVLAIANAARADDAADARREFAEGKTAFDAKQFDVAALHFETAAALAPHAVAYWSAATAWDKAGKTERAADAFARALTLGGLPPDRAKKAAERVDVLERELGIVVVTLAEGSFVKLDDGPERPGPEVRLHGLPGDHVLTVRTANRPPERRPVTLTARTTVSESFTEGMMEEAAAPPPPGAAEDPAPVPPAPRATIRTTGLVLVGVGAGAVAAAGFLALVGLDATEEYNANPTRDRYDTAKTWETLTNVALVTGLASAAIGVGIYFWSASPTPNAKTSASVRLVVTPRGAALGGTF